MVYTEVLYPDVWNNDDNEVKQGTVHRSPGFYCTAEENPRKSQVGDRLMKAVQPVIASNGVVSHSRSGGAEGKD